MKAVIKAVIFQFICVIIFGTIYLIFNKHFVRDPSFNIDKKKDAEFIDCVFLATTVQAGVGYSDLYPITSFSKTLMIIQQFVMISTNVFLLYIFTI